jgi:hypothetical protein
LFNQLFHWLASSTTDSLNKLTDFIFLIILPIEVSGDVIYIIDAILYIIVWIKANQQMRRVGMAWLEQGNTTFNKIIKKNKSNMTTVEQLPQSTVENIQVASNDLPVETIFEPIPELIIEDVEASTENPSDVETLT